MAITIQGIRIKTLTIERDTDGNDKISADYELISSAGKVLAKQRLTSRSDYGSESVFVPSGDTLRELEKAAKAYQKDAEQHLGLME